MALTANSGPDLQPRDFHFLRGLLESRLMTLHHAALLYFNGRKEAAKKRLQKLKRSALLIERRRRVYQPSILLLSKRGFQVLREAGQLPDLPAVTWTEVRRRARVTDAMLRHHLTVLDFKAALTQALAKEDGFSLTEFSTWRLASPIVASIDRNSFDNIQPDAFIRIMDQSQNLEQVFFLEIDRPRELLEHLIARIVRYRDYYRRGDFAQFSGGAPEQYEKFPFRVLIVFRNRQRRNNAAERLLLLSKPILRQAWLATLDEFLANPLGSLWVTPHAYRRFTDQDQRMELTFVKHALLAG